MLCFALLLLCGFTSAAFNKEIHEKYETLSREDFETYFNGLNLGYNFTYYKHLEGKHLSCTILSDDIKFPVKYFDDDYGYLPENFDAREKWPQCDSIRQIYNQDPLGHHCGSCWTFGTATTASDRTCIHTGLSVELAEQDLQCCHICYNRYACNGGDPVQGFEFWRDNGLVTQQCKPYNEDELFQPTCRTTCTNNGVNYQSDKHYGGEIYRVPNNDDAIKAELFNRGPIEAGMVVYEDFPHYTPGTVYEHTYGTQPGHHSIRVIGYGVQNGVEYWLAANSWGTAWGDGGTFKIKRFQPLIGFEDYLLAGIPRS